MQTICSLVTFTLLMMVLADAAQCSEHLGPAVRTDPFVEAEAFEGDPDYWRVRAYRHWAMTDDASGGRYLVAPHGGDMTASAVVQIPSTGAYRLWARFVDLPDTRSPFRVTVRQDDREKATHVFDQVRVQPDEPYRWPTYQNWTWQPMDVTLEAGECTLTLAAFKGAQGSPIIDCFVLTQDLEYEPSAIDFSPPLFARLVLEEMTPAKPALFYFGTQYRGRYAVTQNQFVEGLHVPTRLDDPIVLGDSPAITPWVNITPAIWRTGQSWLEIDLSHGHWSMPESSTWTLELSTTRSEEGLIGRWTRQGPGGGLVMRIDRDDLSRCASAIDLSAQNRAYAESLSPAGRRPEQFMTLTRAWADPARTPLAVIENDLATLAALGFAGGSSMNIDQDLMLKYGLRYEVLTAGVNRDHRYSSRPTEWIRRQVDLRVRPRLEIGKVKVPFIRTGEEIWVPPISDIRNVPEVATAFRNYLREQGLTPDELLSASTPGDEQAWEAVNLTDDAKGKPELYYHSMRFRSRWFAEYHAWAAQQIESWIPGIRVGANTTADLTTSRNMLRRGVDWFEMCRSGGWTFAFIQDANALAPCDQLVGYLFDHLRAAARDHGQPMGTYTMWTRPGPDLAAKAFTEVGRGVKLLNFYDFGPSHAPLPDGRSHQHERYEAIASFNFAVGAVEDQILDAMPIPSDVALLHSNSSDIWDLIHDRKLAGAEAQGLYLILRHLGWAFDVITEDDVLAGLAKHHRLIIVTGANLKPEVADNLLAWTAAGGTLYLGPDAAMRDQFDRPLPDSVAAIVPRKPLTFIETPGYDSTLGNQADVREVTTGGTMLGVISAHQEIDGTGGTVLATYTDNGAPAAVMLPHGKGRLLAVGFPLGAEYPRTGLKILMDQRARLIATSGTDAVFSMWTWSPTVFPESHRDLLQQWLDPSRLSPPVQVNHPLVEANLLASDSDNFRGYVLAISNWSGAPRDVRVAVRLSGAAAPSHATAAIRNVSNEHGLLRFDVSVDYGAFVVIPRALDSGDRE